MLKSLVKPLPRYGKAINAVVLFGVMIFLAGAITGTILHIQAINASKHSFSNKSTGSDSSSTPTPTTSTPTPTTQPVQTTTPSTPTSTTKPKSSTPTSYPTVIDGFVWASPTCHYLAGYGEANDRYVLVQALWTQQSSLASNVSGLINQYNENGLSTSQETLNTINNEITIFNNFVSTTYSQYVSEVNSIGCATTIDTTNIPQVPACTDLSGTVCDDSIWAISIPSLE